MSDDDMDLDAMMGSDDDDDEMAAMLDGSDDNNGAYVSVPGKCLGGARPLAVRAT